MANSPSCRIHPMPPVTLESEAASTGASSRFSGCPACVALRCSGVPERVSLTACRITAAVDRVDGTPRGFEFRAARSGDLSLIEIVSVGPLSPFPMRMKRRLKLTGGRKNPGRQVRTGLTPPGPSARDALLLCPAKVFPTNLCIPCSLRCCSDPLGDFGVSNPCSVRDRAREAQSSAHLENWLWFCIVAYAIEKTGKRTAPPPNWVCFSLRPCRLCARPPLAASRQLTIHPPNAILPSVIVSRSRPGLRKLSLQRLYHTRTVGAGRWRPMAGESASPPTPADARI